MLSLFAAQFLVHGGLLWWRDPELLEERLRPGPGAKLWDKIILGFFASSLLATLVLGGLDYRWGRCGSFGLLWPGASLFCLGSALFAWAMLSNPFFSKVVRLQTERGHRVVTRGPYRWVRHPGYTGFILEWLGIPLMLDSPWALLGFAATTLVLVVRTDLEDRTLAEELEGYPEYQRSVRFRLLPGLW